MNLGGIFPALVTPFEADGSVSLSGMKHNIGLYNPTGLVWAYGNPRRRRASLTNCRRTSAKHSAWCASAERAEE